MIKETHLEVKEKFMPRLTPEEIEEMRRKLKDCEEYGSAYSSLLGNISSCLDEIKALKRDLKWEEKLTNQYIKRVHKTEERLSAAVEVIRKLTSGDSWLMGNAMADAKAFLTDYDRDEKEGEKV